VDQLRRKGWSKNCEVDRLQSTKRSSLQKNRGTRVFLSPSGVVEGEGLPRPRRALWKPLSRGPRGGQCSTEHFANEQKFLGTIWPSLSPSKGLPGDTTWTWRAFAPHNDPKWGETSLFFSSFLQGSWIPVTWMMGSSFQHFDCFPRAAVRGLRR
jgi:hypothetical protein